ncbi:spindle and kinetochore-associated protein 1 [Marchantia polymorpha subsp. ruderalis]|uniref:SKA complex subunit 1 homolog n=2 Tax=Marchantia polymorpha TaxID=3197 RepID=A0AAF6BL77_MARPO|nr:hypothetical protein MARPO_0010s0189 [Marchantia polymorpha]BBN12761.1 hypothetical protein Mp_5g22670 [Marchantia polymorpha subsp. ruderalis]|eukprot:PTQ46819.1 hypothetical protein MARPO_0010s0189 [Marchantia polymorpha]
MMDLHCGSDVSLDQLMGSFNHRIAELQQLMLTRGVQTSNYTADLGSLDVTVRALEQQLLKIKAHLKNDAEALSQAQTLIELSSQQQKKLQQIYSRLPSHLPGVDPVNMEVPYTSFHPPALENGNGSIPPSSTGTPANKEKKKVGPPPKWYLTSEEFASLSSYMRGRLTLDKVNGAIDEMAGFAEANAKLLRTKRQKLGDDIVERVLELREIAFNEAVKGKYFFLESDMRGQILKLDNTGKAILTILRHLGRLGEFRFGRQRAFTLSRP